VSRDPIGYEAGDVSLYRYVFNGPISETDADGLQYGGDPGYMGIGSMGRQLRQWEREGHDRKFAKNLALLRERLGDCCLSLEHCEELRCNEEIHKIVLGLERAYKWIYDRGGPRRLSYFGPVCLDCEKRVSTEVPQGHARSHFQYASIGTYKLFPYTDIEIPGTGHVWGEIICARTGQVITIDFWKGESDFWRPGKDAFGYTRREHR